MWPNLARVLDFSGQWGSATVRLVEGHDAAFTVRRVESMLDDAIKVLQSHERLLNSRQYQIFTIKHRRLLLKVIEVKQDVHNQQARDAFSARPVDRQTYHSEVVQLHGQTEIFYRDVVTASRRAQQDEEDRFFATAQEAEASPDSNWYSIVTSQENSSGVVSDRSSELQDREPLVAVAHVRPTKPTDQNVGSCEDSYRRMLIMEHGDNRVLMYDPNPCSLDQEGDPTNEASLIDMSRAGEIALRTMASDGLAGYEPIEQPEEPSWIDSLIDTMSRLGAGVNTTIV